MPAYRDEKTGKWYVQFSYKDNGGKRRHTCKRGFRTKKDAQKWEFDFKEKVSGSTGMTFGSFVEIYLEAIRVRIKESTYLTKESVIRIHILPYFQEKTSWNGRIASCRSSILEVDEGIRCLF